MEGFNQRKSNDKLYPTFARVLSLLSDVEIFSKYIYDIKFDGNMSSPIGDVDKVPSFSIFWSHSKQKYLFKDWRYDLSGDCIDFVRILFGFSSNREACMQICLDFGIDDFYIDPNLKPSGFSGKIVKKFHKPRGKLKLDVKVRKWEKYDIDYWKTFGISLKWLKKGNVYPIKYYFINGHIRIAEKYSYVYVEKKDGKVTYKIYQPFSKGEIKKWINVNDKSVWELWYLLPKKGKILIINKSRKDSLSVMSTTGIPSTSLQAEGTIPKLQVIEELKNRFDYIFILYDNDFKSSKNWGRMKATKFSENFNIPIIEIPEKYECKDYSDLVKKYGPTFSRKVLIKLIKDKIKNEEKK